MATFKQDQLDAAEHGMDFQNWMLFEIKRLIQTGSSEIGSATAGNQETQIEQQEFSGNSTAQWLFQNNSQLQNVNDKLTDIHEYTFEIANQNSTNVVQVMNFEQGSGTSLKTAINTWIDDNPDFKIISTNMCYDPNSALYVAIIYFS